MLRALAGHFTELLTAVTDDPARHLSLLPILTSDEHQQVIDRDSPGHGHP